MRKRLNTTLGFYSPSFMRLHVGSDLSLEQPDTLKDDFTGSVYLHEFIHFIQDVTTVYGLSNTNITVDYMRFVNNHLIKSSQGGFVVPVQPIPNAADNVHSNLLLANIYNGSGEDDDVTFVSHKTTLASLMASTKLINPTIIEVTYNDHLGNANVFEFGALAIVENMAYIIESECYPNCEPSPDLPYKAAEKLVELIHPSFANDRLNVLALCDASLQIFHPGQFFYETLLKIKNDKITFKKPEEIYSYCRSIQPPFNFHGATDFRSLLLAQSHLAISQITGYFNDPHFQPIKEWLENMIRTAVDYRIFNESFPLDLARGKKLDVNVPFSDFYKRVGTPLVTNNKGDAVLYDPKIKTNKADYTIIWAIDQIHQVFWGNQRNCELKPVCNEGKIKIDGRCDNEPWLRVNDKDLCPFAIMWRHWGLAGYYPI